MTFDEGLVKQLTGGDRITTRLLYQNEFEYRPQFKIIVVCNHKPIIEGTDNAIWRRIHLVPFSVTINDEKASLANDCFPLFQHS